MKKLTIIGASGHGKVVADIASLLGYQVVFLDDDTGKKKCGEWPVVGTTEDVPDGEIFVAIGDAAARRRLMDKWKDRAFPVLIHPCAVVARDVQIGEGSVVMAGAVINSGARLGRGCIVNTAASVDHDCVLQEYVHVAVGAHLCGSVCIGDNTWIGAGSTVINNVSVCGDCVIGAGAVVIKDIDKTGTYVGIPAKKIHR